MELPGKTIYEGSVLGALFHSIGVHVCVYVSSTLLITVALWEVLESGSVSPPALFFLKIVLAIGDHLRFHMYGFFYFCKKVMGILIGIALTLWINLGNIDSLTILSSSQ